MKNLRRLSVITACSLLIGIMFTSSLKLNAQFKYRSEDLAVTVKGNSAVGEWQVKSNKGQLETVFGLNASNKITAVYSLWFTVECESLKGGVNAMEKNTYKALKSNSNETINFILKSSKVKEIIHGIFEVRCTGFLTIAGVEKETELVVNCILNDDKSFACSGTKSLKLSDFDVKIPSAGPNTIQPADDISISYNLKIGRMQ
jgi:hypothetical protein